MSEEKHELVLPAFGKTPEIKLDLNKTKEGEQRLIEAKTVNPITYADLEHCFNESYRELVRNHATVTYQMDMADKALEKAKSDFLIDKYLDLIKDRPKSHDSADLRKAFLMRDDAYVAALDRQAMLKAIEILVTGRIKVFERACSYMKKRMDLIIRSGLSSANLYITQDKK